MQVFMPYSATTLLDLKLSVCCLDPSRLGNQIWREGYTLIRGGWPNHPAAKIWANHKVALAMYCLFGLQELERRGKRYGRWFDYFTRIAETHPYTGLPDIVGYEPFHAGHRAALLAKDPVWYGKFGWIETPEPDTKKAYIWTRG